MSRKHFLRLSHYLIFTIVLASMLTLLIPVSAVRADSVVTFPDPNLEAAIRQAITKPAGDIYQSDLSALTALSANIKGIVDLTGLQYCTSLTSLSLGTNQISAISPLSGLTSLTTLYLYGNQITDISPLSGLTSLTSLRLDINQISTTSPLSGLTNLTYLDLEYNQITNISPLAPLTSLKVLDLDNNQISDISPLSGLTSLTSLYLYFNHLISDVSPLSGLTSLTTLDLNNNQITDISPLSGLTKLKRLPLYGNQITDISPLSALTSLTYLRLGSNDITDISPLSGLTSLGYLDLGYNQISDISPLSSLTSMTDLDLSYNQISNISPLSGLTSLTDLGLSTNHLISDISPLSSLTSLTSLSLYFNQISNISALSNLTKLKYLYIAGNQMSDVSPLSGLTSLTYLDLESNQISDISPLSGLTSLTALRLGYLSFGNQISDISPLSGLTNLTTLYLNNNQISDIGPLVGNIGLGTGDYVYLSSNPLSPTSIYDYIPQLRVRGVAVDWQWGPPAISSVSPSSGIQGQTLSSVVITGTYLTGATSVTFGSGITANSFAVDNATQITANIIIDGAAAVGAKDLSVTTLGGTGTKTGGFTVNQAPPTIATVSPKQGVQGQTLSVTVTGTYLTEASAVSFGSGVTVNSLNVDSSTQITANVTIDDAAAVGSRDVSVTTAGGTATKTTSFSVVATASPPTVASVSPSEGSQGQNLAVTITGTNFTAATAVSFGSGITINNFSVNSDTQMTASISIGSSASIGTRDVSVTTPSGVVTKTDGFTVVQQGASPDETPNNTETGGGGPPFWVWTIIGVAAVLVVGVGAYLIGGRWVAKQ